MADEKSVHSPGDHACTSDARGEVENKPAWRYTAGWWLLLSVPGGFVYLVSFGLHKTLEASIVGLVFLLFGLRWIRRDAIPQPRMRTWPIQWDLGDLCFVVIVSPLVYGALVALFLHVQPWPVTCVGEGQQGIALTVALVAVVLVMPFFAVAWLQVRRRGIPGFVTQMLAAVGGGSMSMAQVTLGGVLFVVVVIVLPTPIPFIGYEWHEDFVSEVLQIWQDGFFADHSYAAPRVIPTPKLNPGTVCALIGPFSLLLAAVARVFYEIRRIWAPRFGWRELPPWPFK